MELLTQALSLWRDRPLPDVADRRFAARTIQRLNALYHIARRELMHAYAELIRATFPPGSVTGAPKVRALEVISELEATPGRSTPGRSDTAASDPHAEYRERLLKAAPLIRALGATLSEEPASSPLRPRPALGVFTSVRVTDGHCRDLDQHLAHLDDSTWRLFG